MSFNIALTGLDAANQDLSVTANNLANVSTTGFKGSRTEFADLYASTQQGDNWYPSGSYMDQWRQTWKCLEFRWIEQLC